VLAGPVLAGPVLAGPPVPDGGNEVFDIVK
jgi:hypothetical protein